MFRLIFGCLMAVCLGLAHANPGEVEVKVKLVAMDGWGYVRFQSKQPLPAGLLNGCTENDWFSVAGDPNIDYRNTTAFKAMVSSLQIAAVMDLPVVVYVSGCAGPGPGSTVDNAVWWVRLKNPTP